MSSPTSGPELNPNLQNSIRQFEHVSAKARKLLTETSDELLRKRPAANHWSALECVIHRNLSNQAMLTRIRESVEATRLPPLVSRRDYKMDFAGKLLVWAREPAARIRLRSSKSTEPLDAEGPQTVLKGWLTTNSRT